MKRFLLLLCLLAFALPGWAQRPVSGQVVSALDNAPLPGASILLKGTTQGTMADEQGRFRLPDVPPGAVLIVQFLGFLPTEVAVPASQTGDLWVSLRQDANQLTEVVVSTGFQQLPRERATGSFSQVDRQRFNEQVSPDVLSRLESVANGLTVDRGTSTGGLMVRGLSTILGGRQPLIILDNFPYEGDLQNINPNDVESVTVLKDAAAASIWGARAGNGVIVITTRKGNYGQPVQVELHSALTSVQDPDLGYLRPIGTSDFIDVEQMLYDRGFYTSQINSSSRPVLSPVVELLVQKANGTLSAAEAETRINALRTVDARDEYARHMYQKALLQQYSLGIKGGSAQHHWLLSLGYDQNKDQLDARYRRATLRFQNTFRPFKALELAAGLSYTLSRTASGRPGYGDIAASSSASLYPYARFADEYGYAVPMPRDYRSSFKRAAANGQLPDWEYYPLEDYRHTPVTGQLQDVLGNLGARLQLPLGLELDFKYQYQRQQNTGQALQDEESYGARDLVNRFTQFNPATGALTFPVPKGAILDQTQALLEAHNGRGQLNFSQVWGDHAVDALAGMEARHARSAAAKARLYGYSPDILTFGNVDFANRYPNSVTGALGYIPHGNDLDDNTNRFVSSFANAAYSFRQTYTFSLSGRRDASNLFGVNANDRWKPLWSAGLGWEISRMGFYRSDLVPFLRLRSSYGFSGNVDQHRAAVTTISYYSSLSPRTQSPYAQFSNYANPELRWETAGIWNLGLDFRLKGERLSGSLEYFRKRGKDLFGPDLLDYTTGIGSTVVRNVASMEGQGVDVELSSLNLKTPSFRWTSHLNLSTSREEVTEYYKASLRGSGLVGSSAILTAEKGRPVYGLYSFRWAGLNPQTGDPQGFLEGQVSQDYAALLGPNVLAPDLRFHGSALPTVYGSLGNTLSFKGFSLTARLTYKLGYYFRRESIRYGSLYASAIGHADYGRRWQKPGDEALTQVPSQVYPAVSNRDSFYGGSEVLVERGDHVRLQYVTAAYELTRETWKRLPLQRLQLQVSAQNLGLLWRANEQGLDPDFQGRTTLSPSRSVSLALRATL
jgi:TonB-dependent starch-binding outer membrane protein SusC